MEFLENYIVLAVLGICLCIGYILKNVVPGEKIIRFIPLIMGLLGAGCNVWIAGALTPDVLLAGLVSGLASTGLYEMFHQFLTKK